MTYQPIIGLEVHVELATKSKMFCGCPAEHFGVEPNTHTCPVCLGLPGALPVPNKKAIEWTILLGLALGCKINEHSKFDRKNYFYPDLPKGYQISQFDEPLCVSGTLQLHETTSREGKAIRITRVHLEEDTGKLQHSTIDGQEVSLIDFNRSGVPLVEIVTEPDFRSIEEVDTYLKELQKIIRYLGISGADMEKGSMRLEPSISLAESGKRPASTRGEIVDSTDLPNYRVELKNINSFRFARRALEFEIKRQTELLEKGETPSQQTRGWSESKAATVLQREKEEANDYRYFPEPDIPPMHLSQNKILEIRNNLCELPQAKFDRFKKDYHLSDYDIGLLTEDRAVADYYEQGVKDLKSTDYGQPTTAPKQVANWIINKKIDVTTTVPADLVKMIVQSQTTSPVDEKSLNVIIENVIKENPKAVSDYKSGKKQVIGVLFGILRKSLKSPPNAEQMELLERKLDGRN